jgi:hypothetical protein
VMIKKTRSGSSHGHPLRGSKIRYRPFRFGC